MSKTEITNPLQISNQSRINYLQNALNLAVRANSKARAEYRNLCNRLSGMLKLSGSQKADLIQKRIAFGKSDMNEDLLRSSLMDAYHSQGMYYNC